MRRPGELTVTVELDTLWDAEAVLLHILKGIRPLGWRKVLGREFSGPVVGGTVEKWIFEKVTE